MKRVNIIYRLKQRLNDIFGTASSGSHEINEWSVQAAMIDNIKRVAAALAGGSIGRPMKGLWLTSGTGINYSIGAGYGFTPTGNVVALKVAVGHILSEDDTKYIYLKHSMAVVDADVVENTDGKKTSVIGKSTPPENIVFDDLATGLKSSVATAVNSIIQESSYLIPADDDLIYLGKIIASGGSITSIENSSVRGLGPNDNNNRYRMPGIHVVHSSIFDSSVTFAEQIALSNGGTVADNKALDVYDIDLRSDLTLGVAAAIKISGGGTGHTGDVVVRDSAGTGTIALHFEKGILVGTTP